MLAQTAESELAAYLTNDALENVVSAFDGFGRTVSSAKGKEIRFQNLQGARRNAIEQFRFDFADDLSTDEWEFISRVFQKRHLLSHKMGVIDEDYVQKAGDPLAVAGRKIHVQTEEVERALEVIQRLGDRLYLGLFPQSE